jgi:hypothetical protein
VRRAGRASNVAARNIVSLTATKLVTRIAFVASNRNAARTDTVIRPELPNRKNTSAVRVIHMTIIEVPNTFLGLVMVKP